MRDREYGFTLIELVVVIVVIGVLAVTALPRFINLSGEASNATSEALFENFRSSVAIYQAACLSRGGNTTDASDTFNINGIRSSDTGSCYPVYADRGNNRRRINAPRSCFWLLENMIPSDYFDNHPPISSTQPHLGGENTRNTVDVSRLPEATEAGYRVFIHQARQHYSYCHFYSITGDLTNAPYLFFNAVDGVMVSGTRDLTQNYTWTEELAAYPGEITVP